MKSRPMLLRLTMASVVVAICGLATTSSIAQDKAPKLEAPSDAAIAAYTDAANLQNNRKYEYAALDWEKFLKNFPDTELSPQADHYAGVCWLQLKDFKKAAPHFEAVVTKWKNVPKFNLVEDGFLNLGWCQYQLGLNDQNGGAGSFAKAADTFYKSIKEYPKGKYVDQVLYFLGDSLYLQSTALANESDALRADGKVEEAKAKGAEAAKRKLASISPLKKLVEEHPKSTMRASALYALGVTYEETKQYPNAAEIFATFLKEFPENKLATEVQMRTAETVAQAGLAAKAANNKAEAKEAFEDAATRFGEVAAVEGFAQADHATFRQADCLLELEKWSDAAKLYAVIPEQFPQSNYVNDAILNAGRYFYRAGNYGDAQTWLDKAVAANTADSPEAAHWLCKIYLNDDGPQKAADLAEKVLPSAGKSEFLVDLKLDQADALFEIDAKRPQSLALYEKIAEEHPSHRLAPQALYNAAFTALDLKLFAQGVKHAENFLTKFPEDVLVPDVKYVQAECNLLQDNYAAAESAYRDLVENYPSHENLALWQIRLAWALYLQDKYAEVIDLLGPLAEKFQSADEIAEANHLVGASQFALKNYGPANTALSAALKANPKWRMADATRLLQSQALFHTDKVKEAIKSVKQLIVDFPNSTRLPEANFRLGEFEYALDNFAASAAAYDKVLAAGKSEFVPFSLWGKGWSELKQDKFDAAIASFTSLIDDHPKHELTADATFARGMCRRHNGDNKGAVQDIDQSIAAGLSDIYTADAQYEKGQAQSALKDYKGAAKSFAAALKAAPKGPLADKCLYELAWAYKSSDQAKPALENFAKLAKEHPKSEYAAEAHFHVGDDLYQRKEYAKAAAEFAEAASGADTDSLSEKSLYKLGWCNYELKKYDQSLQNFQAQVKKYPNGELKADGLVMVAESLFNLEKHEEALPAYVAAREATKNSENATDDMKALVLLHGGQSAYELKKFDEALAMLEPVVADYAKTSFVPQAQFEIGRSLMGQGNYADSVKAFDEARTKASLAGNQGLKARALYMKGAAYFAQKDYANAVKTYDYATGIFSGNSLTDEVKKWLGYATYEAGQCYYVQVRDAKSKQKRAELIKNAKKYFEDVVKNYPGHAVANQAQKQLALLEKTN